MRRSIFLFSLLLFAGIANSSTSDSSRKINPIKYITLGYSQNFTGGELIKRFGGFSSVNGGYFHKTKTNFVFGLEGNILFGARVKENNMFESMTGQSGGLIDANGNIAVIRMYMRGFSSSFAFGKVISLNARTPNTGILLQASVGFIQHKIKFLYSQDITPQLDGSYYKGYDRLTNGVLIKQFAGYQHFSKKFGGHFYIGAEFGQGFTQNRRSYNYDERNADTKKRIDLITSLKAGFIIPLGNTHRNEEEFFQ